MPHADEAPADRRFAILVVEDDREVRETVVALLHHYGFEVRAAADSNTAIRVLMTCPIDLMLTDAIMPGLSGFELAERARVIRPELRVIYLTGHGDRPRDLNGRRQDKVLCKPVRGDELATEIRLALAG